MKKTDQIYNDIQPKNSSAQKDLSNFISSPYNSVNKIETKSAYTTDNNASARKTTKATKKAQNVSSIMTKFAVLFSATTLGIAGVSVLPTTSIVAEINEVEAFDSYVFYQISLNELADGVKVVLYNDFTNREQTVEENEWQGEFEGLKENMYYTLAVKKGNTTLAQKQVFTKTREEDINVDDPTGADPQQGDTKGDPTQGTNGT